MELIENASHQDQLDARNTMYPSTMTCYQEDAKFGSQTSTIYGYVVQGDVTILSDHVIAAVSGGSYFSWAGPGEIQMGHPSSAGNVTAMKAPTPKDRTTVIVIERFGYRGQHHIGHIEEAGRYCYIDGCSDSLLVYPPRMGDPCLNHLHFPTGILQTQHIHPSIRLGIVIGGSGVAWRKSMTHDDGWEKPLKPGGMFMLAEKELHSFKTTDDVLDIVAFHPDTYVGWTDEKHPMLDRTLIQHGGGEI